MQGCTRVSGCFHWGPGQQQINTETPTWRFKIRKHNKYDSNNALKQKREEFDIDMALKALELSW